MVQMDGVVWGVVSLLELVGCSDGGAEEEESERGV